MAKEFALDIFHVLAQIDKKDAQFYNKLSEEQKKGYTPLVAMRWLTGTSDENQIIMVNELVNRFVFTVGDHKELLFKLQCAASSGKSRRYSWLAAKSGAKKPKGLDIVMQYYDYGHREAMGVLPLLSKADIIAMGEDIGLQKDELARLKKDLK